MTSSFHNEAGVADQDGARSPLEEQDVAAGSAPSVVLAGMSAISGALVGFFLAGAFQTSVLLLGMALAAGYLGWRARGLA